MGSRGPKPVEFGELRMWEYVWSREFMFLRDGYGSALVVDTWIEGSTIRAKKRKRKAVYPRRDLWEALVKLRSLKGIAGVCNRWRRWLANVPRQENFLIQPSEDFSAPEYLKQHAKQFLEAKRAKRFPRRRTSADDARLTFLAGAMAGIAVGVSPATAVDRLGRIKHDPNSNEHAAYCWRCQAESARKFRGSELYKSHLQSLLRLAEAQEKAGEKKG